MILLHSVYFYFDFSCCWRCKCVYLFICTVISITQVHLLRRTTMRFINKNKRSDFYLLSFLTELVNTHHFCRVINGSAPLLLLLLAAKCYIICFIFSLGVAFFSSSSSSRNGCVKSKSIIHTICTNDMCHACSKYYAVHRVTNSLSLR